MDLLDLRQRLQIEHGDGFVAAVGGEAVTGFGGNARAVHAGGVGDVAQHFAGGAIDHHQVRAARNEHAASGGFDGDIVGAAVALDIVLLNLEGLRASHAGDGEDACEKHRRCGE